jgi:hypothetical protein
MKAVYLALSHFRATLHLKSLVLATDNTTVVAYLKNQRGNRCFRLEANVEEDKTVGAKCGNALAEQLPRVS